MMKSALQFSGGKDSLALLWFTQALWPFIDVIFMDAGDVYPSTMKRVEEMAKLVPNFIHLKSDAPAYRREHGDPDGETWFRCCTDNIYLPMHEYITANGYRQVLRGTKAVDPHIHAVFPGDMLDGVLFTFPLWFWTDVDVMTYLGDRLPTEYRFGAVGMPDCASCTAIEMCGGTTKRVWDFINRVDTDTSMEKMH
jgi:phosphoadenosine phosphosulfate reductase